jgi:hypothetical protein
VQRKITNCLAAARHSLAANKVSVPLWWWRGYASDDDEVQSLLLKRFACLFPPHDAVSEVKDGLEPQLFEELHRGLAAAACLTVDEVGFGLVQRGELLFKISLLDVDVFGPRNVTLVELVLGPHVDDGDLALLDEFLRDGRADV